MKQLHLGPKQRINLGSYYTPPKYVEQAWAMLEPYLPAKTVVCDSSCGYGHFLKNSSRHIGCDIDETAIARARRTRPKARFLQRNALESISRQSYRIPAKAKLAMVGNPPYNDRTSLIRRDIKQPSCAIDEAVSRRDMGMSFLLSYGVLKADYVCVLHPLSYLIKQANFKTLRPFTEDYRLLQGVLISSSEFEEASKTTDFPIIIALYERSPLGMDYEYIRNFAFRVDDTEFILCKRNPLGRDCEHIRTFAFKVNGMEFMPGKFDYVNSYIDKYPRRHSSVDDESSLFFWTMRDINALKRNRTFVHKHSSNTIVIDKGKLDYYAYVDVFKRFADCVPYYFGNCDVPIDQQLFRKFRKFFVANSVRNNPYLAKHLACEKFTEQETGRQIKTYLASMLGRHYAG